LKAGPPNKYKTTCLNALYYLFVFIKKHTHLRKKMEQLTRKLSVFSDYISNHLIYDPQRTRHLCIANKSVTEYSR